MSAEMAAPFVEPEALSANATPPIHEQRERRRCGSRFHINEETAVRSNVVLVAAADHVQPAAYLSRLKQR
jgi:hypothetical protein